MATVLYISYDGMAEPLGQSQVIAYLEKLAGEHRLHIMSYEKPADLDNPRIMARVKARLDAAGIGWTPLRYHSRPSAPATVYDIVIGQARAMALCRSLRPEIIHVRSYIPALIALPLKRLFDVRLLFDIRGFWPDERVDGGLWPADGAVYRTVKGLEKNLFRAADHVVTLTEASVPIIASMDFGASVTPPISVVPTCADLDRFAPPIVPPDGQFTFGYVGSFGTWYLMDETMRLFRAICEKRPDARMLIINRHEHDAIRRAANAAGIAADQMEITQSDHADVPQHIHRMHAGSALIKPCFSKLSSAPTKLAEYLGCGVPCVGNIGVGDIESICEGRRVGVAMLAFHDADMAAAAERILALTADPGAAQRCRTTAIELFSLSGGVAAYRTIYAALSNGKGWRPRALSS